MVSQERVNGKQVFPAPGNGACVPENPPVFVWLPMTKDAEQVYECVVWDKQGNVVWRNTVSEHFCVPDEPLPVGTYEWDVQAIGTEFRRGKQSFQVTEKAIVFIRPTLEEVLSGIPKRHPRHLFSKQEIQDIVEKKKPEIDTLKRNIAQAYKDGLPMRPMYHVNESAIPYREYFGRFRDFCDRNLVACALGYALLDDEEAGKFAKKLFLHICDWNPAGPCSLAGPWGDEVGLSCARCFPAVFDLLYPLFTEKERRYAGETVAQYAFQCEQKMSRIHFTSNPGDSHAGRLPAYLGEAALVLWGEGILPEKILTSWLKKALHIYGGIFPHYGGADGSWAEGPFYSTSYTKWYLPFFSAIARYTGKNFLQRPFYRNYARFLLHFGLPDHEIHPFGDGYWCTPDSKEWPGFYAQNPFRTYADLSAIPKAKEFETTLGAPELFSLHLLDVFLPKQHIPDGYQAADIKDAEAFHDGGFVSLHSDHCTPESDLHVVARASKFGPGSHRQPDNGSFAVFYGGTALITPSGYFGRAYGSKHHRQWFNTTKAHNVILVDGVGQSWEDFRHTAGILSCEMSGEKRKAVLALQPSYPMVESYFRTFEMIGRKQIIIEDVISAKEPVSITYPLHMMSKPKVEPEGITEYRNGIKMTIRMEMEAEYEVAFSDKYDVDLNEGEPQEYHVEQPSQYHIYWQTEKKKEHRMKLVIEVGEVDENNT